MKKILVAVLTALVALIPTVAFAAPAPRDVKMPVLQAIKTTINYTDITSNSARASKTIGTIPSGAFIVGSVVAVRTGFTAAALASMSIGTSVTTASESVMADTDLLCQTAGRKLGTLSPAVSGNTTFNVYTLASDYTQLAAGSADVIIYYYTGSN